MSYLAVYAALLLGFLNLFVQLPLTPVYARELTPVLWHVGIAVSAYSMANLAGNLGAGLLIDRWPRAPLVSLGLLAGGGALAAAGTGPRDVWWLAGCLALNGLAMAVVTPAAFTLLLQRLADDPRAAALARSGAAIGLAALVGPAIGGILGDAVGTPRAFQLVGAALVLAALALWPLRGKAAATEAAGPGLAELRAVALLPPLRLAWVGAFALMAVNGALVFLLPPAVKAMGAPAKATGALFGAFALVALALFLAPASRRIAAADARRTTAVGTLLTATACLALATAQGLPAMAACMALYGLGFGVVYLGATAALARHAPAALRGTATGVFYAVFSLGAALGPLVLARLGLGGPSGLSAAAALPAAIALVLLLTPGPASSTAEGRDCAGS